MDKSQNYFVHVILTILFQVQYTWTPWCPAAAAKLLGKGMHFGVVGSLDVRIILPAEL